MLSKIERGPTLPTLLRIAMVFNVGLEHFFVPDTGRPQVAVIRKPDRLGSRTGPVLSRRPICLRASITRSPNQKSWHFMPSSRAMPRLPNRIGMTAPS